MLTQQQLHKILNEMLEEKPVATTKTIADMMDSLAKSLDVKIYKRDNGDYCIDESDPHYVIIKPITYDYYNLEYYKDKTDRKRYVFISYKELRLKLKNLFVYDKKNYVDSARDKCVQNSKHAERGGNPEARVVNFGTPNKIEYAKNMNEPYDDPDQEWYSPKNVKKQLEHDEIKPSYKIPKLPKALQKLKPKYTKTGKLRKYKTK